MSTQESKQRMDLLKRHLKESKEECDSKCAKIDADVLADQRTSGTMNSKEQKGKKVKQIKKGNMKLENPYSAPDPNEKTTGIYDMSEHEKSQEKKNTYTQEDINNAHDTWTKEKFSGTKNDSETQTNTESLEDLQARVLELSQKRADLRRNGTTEEEFQKKKKKLREAEKMLKDAEQSNEKASDEMSDGEIDALAEEELADGIVRERNNRKTSNEMSEDQIDALAEEELADRMAREKNTKEPAEKDETNMEELRAALDKARDALVTKKRRAETSIDKIKSLLGKVSVGNASDEIKQIEDEYNSILMQVKDKLLQERDSENTSEERKREINAEIKFMAINEGIKLNDAETKARLETKWGAFGDKVNKVGLWYKNLPKGVKYAMAGALFAGGTALTMSGGGVVAGGALASIKGLKRIFGATAVGAGVGAGLEAKVNAKRQGKLMEAMKKFGEMSLEEQNEIINGIDNFNKKTQEEYEEIKTSRRRIKFAAISSAAALLVGGKVVSHLMSGDGVGDAVHEHISGEHLRVLSAQELAQETKYGDSVFNSMSQEFTNDMKHTEAFKVFKNKYGTDAYLKYLQNGGDDTKWQKKVENALKLYKESAKHQLDLDVVAHGGVHEGVGTDWVGHEEDFYIKDTLEEDDKLAQIADNKAQIAHSLAKKMGIDNPDKVEFSDDLSKINGQKVPEGLLTDEQRAVIETNHKLNMGYTDAQHVKSEYMQRARELPETDRDRFEQEADKAFAQYQLTGKIPDDISETVATTEVPVPELSEVSIDVKPGDNLWNLIKAQLKTNSQFEGMTEDQRIMAIDELKDKFAGMSHEDLKNIGFRSGDINKIYPGDKLNLTGVMGDSETIKHALSTGKHFTGELETHEIPVSEHEDISGAEKAVDTKPISSDAQYIIHHNYGLTDEDFARIENTPVSKILDQAAGEDPRMWSPLERDLMEFNGLDERVGQQTVGEVLRETTLYHDHVNDTVASVAQEQVQEATDSATNHFEGMTETEVLRELVGNKEFKTAVAQQIQEVFGTTNITDALRNIAPKDMNFFLSEGYTGQEKEMVLALRDRAMKAFGESGNPKPGAKVGEYITRIFAKAIHEGKVKDVFPSSTFSK